MSNRRRRFRAGRLHRLVALTCAFAVVISTPVLAQAKKAPRKAAPGAASAAPASPPKVQAAMDWVLDRRSTSDFPSPELSVTLRLEGEDVAAVQSARARVTKAVDDTGKDLIQPPGKGVMGGDGWQEKRENAPPGARIALASPSRKARSLTVLEGVLEAYLPARDPAATVKVDAVLTKKDKPLVVAALANQRIKLQVLSKAGLEKEKKQAEARKAEAAKKKGAKKAEGMDGMAEAMATTMVNAIESLFSNVGDNDLILKVDDPGKKVFSFDLAAPDGSPVRSYGMTDMEGYRVLRMFAPIPPGSALLVRLKTAKSFAEIPFSIPNVKLP